MQAYKFKRNQPYFFLFSHPLETFRKEQFPDVPDGQCVNYDTDDTHESDIEYDGQVDILPKWLSNRQDMVFSPECIDMKEMIGHGQYGTVHKGVFHYGNAM